MSTAANLIDLFYVRRNIWDPEDDDRNRPPERSWLTITHAEVHHLGDNRAHPHGSATEELRRAERYHEDSRGWRDLFYNVAVDPHEGIIFEGRAWWLPSQPDLRDTLTVLIVGDGRHDALSQAATNSLRSIAGLFERPLQVHSERAATFCPSPAYTAVVDAINNTRPLEDRFSMTKLIDTTTGQGWVTADGKARELSDPDGFDFDGPTYRSSRMRYVVADLYQIVD